MLRISRSLFDSNIICDDFVIRIVHMDAVAVILFNSRCWKNCAHWYQQLVISNWIEQVHVSKM